MKRIYLDYNATTPLDPDVADSMAATSRRIYGNPSSVHQEGQDAKSLLDESRETIARFLNCSAQEVVFTGSGSESNSLAIHGILASCGRRGNHLVTSRVEHPSVLKVFQYLETCGWEVTWLDVDDRGHLDLKDIKSSLRNDTVLMSIMTANNETGVIFPVREIAAIARERNVLFHTDAVQAVGKVPLDVKDLDVDLLSLAGHKFYGPKGVGGLYVRKGVNVEPLIRGGGQERGRRGGTENLSGIAGLARAAEISMESLSAETGRIVKLKSRLKAGMSEIGRMVCFNTDHEQVLPNTLSVSFKGVSGESLLMALDLEGISLSAGSACSSGALTPSHVLLAMGLDEETIRGTVRVSLGRWTTEEEVETFLEVLPQIISRLASA